MRDPLLDLFLGSRCVVCGRPGRLLCTRCRAALPDTGSPARPDPAPAGLIAVYTAGRYEEPLRPLLVGLKERRQVALAGPLGRVLGAVVRDLVRAEGGGLPDGSRVVLVPVPSSGRARRARGHDHTLSLARVAAGACRGSGLTVAVAPMLRHRGRASDQAGLSRAERERNASGRFVVTGSGLAVARSRGSLLVVVDDILTTGHTMREAQLALLGSGLPVLGGAVVAATERRAGRRGYKGVHPPYRAGTAEATV